MTGLVAQLARPRFATLDLARRAVEDALSAAVRDGLHVRDVTEALWYGGIEVGAPVRDAVEQWLGDSERSFVHTDGCPCGASFPHGDRWWHRGDCAYARVPEPHVALALASDAEGVRLAESRALEVLESLVPWGLPSSKVTFAWAAYQVDESNVASAAAGIFRPENIFGRSFGSARRALELAVHDASAIHDTVDRIHKQLRQALELTPAKNTTFPWEAVSLADYALRSQLRWEAACKDELSVPTREALGIGEPFSEQIPTGTPFSALKSPFLPLLELLRTGHLPIAYHEGQFLLGAPVPTSVSEDPKFNQSRK